MKGIDISVYQMGADWKKVKNSGIEFAMIKASQGGVIRDQRATRCLKKPSFS